MEIEKKFASCGPYTILSTLGKGGQGKVKLGQDQDGNKFALKFITLIKPEAIQKELKILQSLNHENLVKLIEFHASIIYTKKNGVQISKTCFVFEYCEGGELFEYIAQTGRFHEDICRFYFKQFFSALYYLHSKGIAHRDIKPENLLLDSEFKLKLADFGFATFINSKDGTMTTQLGTPGYMAPEIVARQTYNGQCVDIFASGVVLFIMMTGAPPFSEASTKDPNYRCFCTHKFNDFWSARFPSAKGEFRTLINSMLAIDPTQRPSLSEIFATAWFQGPISNPQKFQQNLTLRKKEIDLQAMREKLKKMAEKQNQIEKPKYKNLLQKPPGVFRDDVEGEEKKTKKMRLFKFAKSDAHHFLTVIDKDQLIEYLLSNREKFCKDILEISEKYYKFTFIYEKKNQDQISELIMSLELKFVENDVLSVYFTKEKGEYTDYFQKISEIQELVNIFE